MFRTRFVVLGGLLLGALGAAGCGPSGSDDPVGPAAVTNGSTLASAQTHWVSGSCPCGGATMTIAADGTVRSNYCNWGSVQGTWTAIDAGKTMLISYPSPPAQHYFTSMRSIEGTTASGVFTGAGVGEDGTVSNCYWTLVGMP